jgi:hypothetical protein
MIKVVLFVVSIVIAGMTISCNEKTNPNSPIVNKPTDSSLIDSVKVTVIVKDTMQSHIDQLWQIAIDKPDLIDKIIITDSIENDPDAKMKPFKTYYKGNIKDTIAWYLMYDYEMTYHARITWFVGNQSRDTSITLYVLDTIPVNIKSGSFATQNLTEGDSLKLFVNTEPFTYVPYTCQWYKDGQKIWDTIYTEYSTTVKYSKANISMADSGTYSIDIYRAHSRVNYGPMNVHVKQKQ